VKAAPLVLAATLAAGTARAQTPDRREAVDLLLFGGPVLTEDSTGTVARAVAIRDGRVVAVGGDELVNRYRARESIDLRGRAAAPGFDDTHIHIAGDPPWHLDLTRVRSIVEIERLIRAKARALGPGRWITGYGWSEDELAERRRPLRADLDRAAPRNPVLIHRAGGHSGVANSRALEIARLTETSPDPDQGVLERDQAGRLNGVIRERQDVVEKFVPAATPEQLRPSLVAKLEALLPLGITSIIEASTPPGEFSQWERVYRDHRGELPRAAVQILWPGAEGLAAFGRKSGDGDEWLRVGALKIFADGGFTGPAAYTLEPYRGQPSYRGKLRWSPEELHTILTTAHRMGWQVGVHTIGDGAIALTVSLLDQVLRQSPRADHRHYLNHFSMLPPESTLVTMARNRIGIAQQPNFTYTIEGRYAANLEGERLAHNNPLATPIEHGIFLALGSDIMPIGPILGLYAAVTRRGMSGAVYGPDERLPLADAIRRYTRYGPYLTREESIKGSLEPGKVADLVVFSENILATPADSLRRVTIDLTLLGGRVVHRRRG
jgi:predicted amidohydrolase YtcJ